MMNISDNNTWGAPWDFEEFDHNPPMPLLQHPEYPAYAEEEEWDLPPPLAERSRFQVTDDLIAQAKALAQFRATDDLIAQAKDSADLYGVGKPSVRRGLSFSFPPEMNGKPNEFTIQTVPKKAALPPKAALPKTLPKAEATAPQISNRSTTKKNKQSDYIYPSERYMTSTTSAHEQSNSKDVAVLVAEIQTPFAQEVRAYLVDHKEFLAHFTSYLDDSMTSRFNKRDGASITKNALGIYMEDELWKLITKHGRPIYQPAVYAANIQAFARVIFR